MLDIVLIKYIQDFSLMAILMMVMIVEEVKLRHDGGFIFLYCRGIHVFTSFLMELSVMRASFSYIVEISMYSRVF
jgi:hypothetical protein